MEYVLCTAAPQPSFENRPRRVCVCVLPFATYRAWHVGYVPDTCHIYERLVFLRDSAVLSVFYQ